MRPGNIRRLAAVACGLIASAAPLAATPAQSRSVTSAAPVADVLIHPGVMQLSASRASGPTTTADCKAAFGVACYVVAQIQQAYDLPALYAQGITGAGSTIVIVDSFGSPTIRHDLAVFDTAFGLPAPPSFQVIAPAGRLPRFNPKDSDMTGWAGETTLDVEWAHAIAPGASIVLAETPVSETEGVQGFPQIVTAEKYVLSHYHATVISQSFSATEQTFPSKVSVAPLRAAYIAAARQHVTVLAASGDNGATDFMLNGKDDYLYPVTSWPDSDPLVTGVGGTQLHLNADGARTAPDTAWNDTYSRAVNEFVFGDAGPNPDASGGGKSILFGRPWYQSSVKNIVGTSRGVPDIAMSAACDGSVDTYSSYPGAPAGWGQTCGTSEATPLFAGIVALAAQVAGHPLGLINPALYAMSAAHVPGIVAVTTGDNTVTFTQGGRKHTVRGYAARAGYSLVTGVGTVDARLFVPELARRAG